MKTRLLSHLLAALTALACALSPLGTAAAKEYEPLYGYGTHSARVGLQVGLLSGLAPTGSSSAAYSQNTYSAWFNALAFAEPTVFGTLLGFEFNAALGIRTVSKPDAVADPEGLFQGVSPYGRMDFEFAYDLVHWKLWALRQRVILDVGGGFELNSHPWQILNGGSAWRGYPLVGGHVQTVLGNSLVLDLSYRFVPTQTQDNAVSEHRLIAGLGIGQLTVGAQVFTTRLLRASGETLDQNQIGGYALYSF